MLLIDDREDEGWADIMIDSDALFPANEANNSKRKRKSEILGVLKVYVEELQKKRKVKTTIDGEISFDGKLSILLQTA